MRRALTTLLALSIALLLGLTAVSFAQAPSTGGTFRPLQNYVVSGTWLFKHATAPISFEGSADDAFETTLVATNPTADRTITIPNASGTVVLGASGLKIAAGSVTLDGSNPSSVTTGLAAITACTVVDKRSTTPGDEVTALTTATAAVAGRLDVYAWTTNGTDPTLVASSDSDDVIDYVCVGT